MTSTNTSEPGDSPTKPPSNTDNDYYFDAEAGARAVQFFPKFIRHVKGKLANKPLHLLDYQAEAVYNVFGWKRKTDHTRRYRFLMQFVGRKNSKSTQSAGLAILLTGADNEPGAEVYCAAGDKEQAKIIFNIASSMIKKDPILSLQFKIWKTAIEHVKSESVLRALTAEHATKHGFNAHGIIFDEIHVQKTRELWDVLTTSRGARAQPLVVGISTNGHDKTSLCFDLYSMAKKVIAEPEIDPELFAQVYEVGMDEDWTNEKLWEKANPGLGQSVTIEYLRAEFRKARQLPYYENTFRNLYLNQWTSQEFRLIPMVEWERCVCDIEIAALAGQPCFCGIDLASNQDMSCAVLVFQRPGGVVKVQPYFFVPEETARTKRTQQDHLLYKHWIEQGLIIETPGKTTDYGFIRAKLVELGQKFQIRQIVFDKWNSSQLSLELEALGFECIQHPQSPSSFSAPTKELIRLIIDGKLDHGHNPVLAWMADNVVGEEDSNGNIKANKKKSREKIDGIVAAIMALGCAMRSPPEFKSKYEEGHLTVI